jgi:hypothetical protein
MTDFQVGGLYFWIQYADREQLFLLPRSVVFIGKNLDPTVTGDSWSFQDTESHRIYGPETYSQAFDREVTEQEIAEIARKALPTTLVTLQTGNLCSIVDCEGLAKAASDCAIRRAKAGMRA